MEKYNHLFVSKRIGSRWKRVLVIDSDESNYGLHRQLGMELPKDFTAFFGGKEAVLKDMMLSNFAHKFFDGPWSLSDIPEGYLKYYGRYSEEPPALL